MNSLGSPEFIKFREALWFFRPLVDVVLFGIHPKFSVGNKIEKRSTAFQPRRRPRFFASVCQVGHFSMLDFGCILFSICPKIEKGDKFLDMTRTFSRCSRTRHSPEKSKTERQVLQGFFKCCTKRHRRHGSKTPAVFPDFFRIGLKKAAAIERDRF